MSEIIVINKDEAEEKNKDVVEMINTALLDTVENKYNETLSIPFVELSALGSIAMSLVPQFRTITQTTTINADGLFRVANAEIGDALKKVKKNGNFWGAMKNAEGKSKLAQLAPVSSVSSAQETVVPIDPATIIICAALVVINQKLDKVIETGEDVISFLDNIQQAEVKANLETLLNTMKNFSNICDNDIELRSQHKLAIDIKKDSRKDIKVYQVKINRIIDKENKVITQAKLSEEINNLVSDFQYYRLGLYSFSLSSLLDVLLSGNFKKDYINATNEEIEAIAKEYRILFDKASGYIEKKYNDAIDTFALKGIGKASDAVGSFIGKIPVISKGPIDEFLQEKGKKLQRSIDKTELKTLKQFAVLSNPGVRPFVEELNSLNYIVNKTKDIYFDNSQILLVS